ncbi:hypothetical protein KVV02_002117 [Mortierella alpina]|uniref:Pre-mRNA-processing factor 39 n=1 Tax=Mortierella alpina TaxID=64518 RepID=A0A9P8D0A8_MORAP|nr:hypothetical protein KVV02_002117 [Mortierella alpina]
MFSLFERGASAVGMDFMPHVFWDKFIAFYEEKEEYSKLAALMERIIKIPMHQYARYYQQYAQLVSTRPLSEWVSEEKYNEYKAQLTASKSAAEQDQNATSEEAEKPKEELESQMRQLILESSALVHARTAEETNKRWPFEAEIKRPYFHVKPMDMPQLDNWRRYLDFEEAEGDVERIRVLFERCLVTCALYEEFWLRYGSWARSQNDLDALRDIYSRAVVMVPPSNPSLRLTLAMVEEERGAIENAREHYQAILQQLPGHIETIVRFANFERRMAPSDLAAAEVVYASQLGLENVDEQTQTAIVTLYARFLWQAKKDTEAARAIFKTGIRYSGLPEAVKNDYAQSYLDFVMEFGSSAARYSQLEADIKAPSVYVTESKKRAAAEQAQEEERAKKQARSEDDATMGEQTEGAASVDGQTSAPLPGMDPSAMYGQQQPQWGAADAAAAYGYPATAYPYGGAPVQAGTHWGYGQAGGAGAGANSTSAPY